MMPWSIVREKRGHLGAYLDYLHHTFWYISSRDKTGTSDAFCGPWWVPSLGCDIESFQAPNSALVTIPGRTVSDRLSICAYTEDSYNKSCGISSDTVYPRYVTIGQEVNAAQTHRCEIPLVGAESYLKMCIVPAPFDDICGLP